MSDGMGDEQEWLREREELIHALRNFAEHFGATEVYQQARAIYLETPGGKADREKQRAADFDSVLQNANRPASEHQKRPTPGRRTGRGSPALEDAKKMLGG